MEDWKKRIQDRLMQEEARRSASHQGKSDHEIEQEKEKAKREKWSRDMTAHYHRYPCHINGCNESASSGPVKILVRKGSFHNMGENSTWDAPVFEEDWSRTVGLHKCSRCGKLTCLKHLHREICKSCGEKM